jgi:hypothetical protein
MMKSLNTITVQILGNMTTMSSTNPRQEPAKRKGEHLQIQEGGGTVEDPECRRGSKGGGAVDLDCRGGRRGTGDGGGGSSLTKGGGDDSLTRDGVDSGGAPTLGWGRGVVEWTVT